MASMDNELELWLRRGAHYRPLFDWLQNHDCRAIMEIGTHNGRNGLMMIKAASARLDEREITYYGFDLFEGLNPELREKELSYRCPGQVRLIRDFMRRRTAAQVELCQGDTKETLPRYSSDVKMDVIYVDGGHSLETTRSDWQNVQRFVKENTVVFLDDYFTDRVDAGCRFLLPEMPGAHVLPQIDSYKQPDGSILRVQLVQVKDRAGQMGMTY